MNDVIQDPDEIPPQSVVKDGIDIHPILVEPSLVSPEQLLPYGEAAKAIFIRANGVTAYNREIRFVRRAD